MFERQWVINTKHIQSHLREKTKTDAMNTINRPIYTSILLVITVMVFINTILLIRDTHDSKTGQNNLVKEIKDEWTKEAEIRTDMAVLDLNGDSISEKVVIASIKRDSGDIDRVLIAYNHAGEMIGKSDSNFVGQIPNGATIEAKPPYAFGPKLFLKMSYTDDLGQEKTMFFTLKNLVISPVCKVEYPINIKDCIFSTAIGGINPQYLEEDGNMDIFEVSDKNNLPEGIYDLEEINNASSSGKLNKKDHSTLLSVDAIYIYNNGYFQSQHGYLYNKIFDDYSHLFSYWNKDIKLIKGY